jgi:predicted nucleotidyltransferase
MPPLVRAAVGRFHDALREGFGQRLREFVLFGSHARGDAHEDSDVDMLVVVDSLSEDERKVVFDLAYDAGATGDELIVLSPLPYATSQAEELRRRERRLMLEIDRDGVAL